MKNVIHIYGASGSGTSTLGRKISQELGYKFMDTDDYFWLPTNPQYTTKRSKAERLALMKKDILENDNVVIAGSLVDWGDELIPLFTLAVRLVTDTEIRIERLEKREKQKFGDRILPDGDMYTTHMKFMEWARAYDTGSVEMRSKAKHDEWQKLLHCKQIVLDGAADPEDNFQAVQAVINSGRNYCEIVILEGIMYADWYKPLFELAVQLYGTNILAYYFDLPFEETLRRHQTKPNCNDFGEEAMRRWWRDKDFSEVLNEHVITAEKDIQTIIREICDSV